jgi:hypothetical protein
MDREIHCIGFQVRYCACCREAICSDRAGKVRRTPKEAAGVRSRHGHCPAAIPSERTLVKDLTSAKGTNADKRGAIASSSSTLTAMRGCRSTTSLCPFDHVRRACRPRTVRTSGSNNPGPSVTGTSSARPPTNTFMSPMFFGLEYVTACHLRRKAAKRKSHRVAVDTQQVEGGAGVSSRSCPALPAASGGTIPFGTAAFNSIVSGPGGLAIFAAMRRASRG